jgi:hypothetical protein
MNLETRIDKLQGKWAETVVKLADNPVYKYAVDVVSGWTYYTITYGLQEIAAQEIATGHLDMDKVIKTRLIGMGVQAAVLRPVGMLRNHIAKKYDVTKESSFKDKLKVNFIATTPIQSTVYSGMLLGGMAWSGNWDWKSFGYALLMGIGFSALHSFPYGVVQDRTRKFFGIKPAIGNKEPDNKYINSDKKYLSQ